MTRDLDQSPPEIVLRAAEQLSRQGSAHTQASVPARQMHFLGGRRSIAPQAPPDGAEGRTQTVTISPAVLAANGIHLPYTGTGMALTLEEYRSIRRHVLSNITRAGEMALENRASNLVLVTSARPGDGKTFSSIQLALSIASGGERNVLLMDGDARRCSLSNYMGINCKLGWVDVLERDDVALVDAILSTNINRLQLLPSGKPSQDLSDLIDSRKMAALIRDLSLRDSDAVIIIDSLPCLVSNEPAILAELAGQVVFVVAANETGKDEVEASLRQLSGAAIISLVLNKGEPLMAEQFARYGYYYHSGQTQE